MASTRFFTFLTGHGQTSSQPSREWKGARAISSIARISTLKTQYDN